MSLDLVRKQAKEAGIAWRDVIRAKRELMSYHEEQQHFIDCVRQTAFKRLTGRTDRFWMIFGHTCDRTYGHWFHGGGDYDTIKGFDVVANGMQMEFPQLCNEEDASETLYSFLKDQPFRIPCNDDLYKEAFQMLSSSVAVPF